MSFFDIGGHSLLATEVVARLRDGFGKSISLVKFFELPRVGDLAAYLDSARETALPDLVPQTRPARIPASYAQLRLWFIYRFDPRSVAYNISLGVELVVLSMSTGSSVHSIA